MFLPWRSKLEPGWPTKAKRLKLGNKDEEVESKECYVVHRPKIPMSSEYDNLHDPSRNGFYNSKNFSQNNFDIFVKQQFEITFHSLLILIFASSVFHFFLTNPREKGLQI